MDSVKIQNLMNYAKDQLCLNEVDEIYARNRVLDIVKELDFFECSGDIDTKNLECPDKVIDPILDELIEKGTIDVSEREEYLCKILDTVSLKPSEIKNRFDELYKENHEKAFRWLFEYSNKNGYVKYTNIKNNLFWEAKNTERSIDITINLSKPEKSVADVKKAFKAVVNYPKCVICKENMGYHGHSTEKHNLRGLTLIVGGEPWFFQYSPYGYFNEHGILINENHTKMVVEPSNVERLLDFLDINDEYFIGFNAALPIVGGSILAHDHYQCGKTVLPMMKRSISKEYYLEGNSSKIGILDWYNNVVQIKNASKEELLKVSTLIINSWKEYNDSVYGIIAKEEEDHNSLSAVTFKENGEYVVNLILRNNITSSEYPDGVYHAHPEYHNIKKEAIGLIEAAGMFILPARLKRQLSVIANVLSGEPYEWNEDMNVHNAMKDKLVKEFGIANSKEEAEVIVKNEVNKVCENILKNTAVFKENNEGRKAFNKYMLSIGLEEK